MNVYTEAKWLLKSSAAIVFLNDPLNLASTLPDSWAMSLACTIYEPRHEISNNVVCATSKASDQPAHTRSLIRVFAGRLNIFKC